MVGMAMAIILPSHNIYPIVIITLLVILTLALIQEKLIG